MARKGEVRKYFVYTVNTGGQWMRKCNSIKECNDVIKEQKRDRRYVGPATIYKFVKQDTEIRSRYGF